MSRVPVGSRGKSWFSQPCMTTTANQRARTRPTEVGMPASPGLLLAYNDNLGRLASGLTPSGHATEHCYGLDTSCVRSPCAIGTSESHRARCRCRRRLA
jgi:hypothetical protein